MKRKNRPPQISVDKVFYAVVLSWATVQCVLLLLSEL
jgi:hypothetical protein